MSPSVPLEVAPSAFSGRVGLARRDTTPPEGIYARMWGPPRTTSPTRSGNSPMPN